MKYSLLILYIFLLFACNSEPQLTLQETDTSIDVALDGKPVLSYATEVRLPDSLPAYYARSGFIHPVYSPNGQLVTDDFPVGHSHQHAIFTAWTNTTFRGEFHDFWNQQKETATVKHVAVLETIDSGSVVGFTSKLHHVSLKHGTVLEEIWRVRVHNQEAPYVWDLRSEQTNVTSDTLYLNKHVYGGLGVRGHAEWNAADSLNFRQAGEFLTSEGRGRDDGNHTRPEWVAIYGNLSSGGKAGVAVLQHPKNFRSPQFTRLHPEMPYLSVTPVVEEGFFIAPGETYVARWRFVVFDGEVKKALADLSTIGWSD